MDNGDYGSIFSNLVFTLIVVILVFIMSLLSVPFFIVTCCCNKNNGQSGRVKLYFMITVGFLIGFLVVFILLSVTIGKIEGSYNEVNCVTAKLPNDILNGYSGSIQFIGLYGLQDMLDSLLTEVDQIS